MSTVSEASQGQRAPDTHIERPFISYRFLTPAGTELYHFIRFNRRNIHPPNPEDAHTSTADIVVGQDQTQPGSASSGKPSQPTLLGIPQEIRDMILHYALPDVTFCVAEDHWPSGHNHPSNNNQSGGNQTPFEYETAAYTVNPDAYRAQRSIHLSMNTGGTPSHSLQKANLRTSLALLSTNYKLRFEFQDVLNRYAPTSFVVDSTWGSPTFTLANETLGTLDSAKLRKISHLSVFGLRPPSGDRDMSMPHQTSPRTLRELKYYFDQQELFLALLATMRLKTLTLQIDVEGIFWHLPAMQVNCSWLQPFWELPGLSGMQFHFIAPAKPALEDASGGHLGQLVKELNVFEGVSAHIVGK